MKKIKIVKESKWQKAYDLRGKTIMVKTIWENCNGVVYSRRVALREAR